MGPRGNPVVVPEPAQAYVIARFPGEMQAIRVRELASSRWGETPPIHAIPTVYVAGAKRNTVHLVRYRDRPGSHPWRVA